MDADTWATVGLTAVLVGATIWYARETSAMAADMKHQTDEMKAQTEQMRLQVDAAIAPIVSLRAVRQDGLVTLALENSGRSPARNVQLSLDRQVPTYHNNWHQPLRECRPFKRPLPYLAPDTTLSTVLGSELWVTTEAHNAFGPFVVTISYVWRDQALEESVPIEVHSLFSQPELLRLCNEYQNRPCL